MLHLTQLMTQQPPDLRPLSSAEQGCEMQPFELMCQANFLSVRSALQAVTEELQKSRGKNRYPTDETELVLAEVLNNIVEHGYKDNPEGEIKITLSYCIEGLRIVTQDTGVSMPGLTIPSPQPVETDVTLYNLPEGGFGWSLIHLMTSECFYQRKMDSNYLCFVIPPR